MSSLLTMARSGGLDGALTETGSFYQTNYTKALLFLSDGSYLEDLASKQNLLGSQWGMMNETGQLPRPGLALALHVLVPGAAVLDLGERRRADLGDHGAPLRGVRADPVHPGRAVDPEVDPDLQADLARLLRAARKTAASSEHKEATDV